MITQVKPSIKTLSVRAQAFNNPFLPAEAKTLLVDMALAIEAVEARLQALQATTTESKP